MLNRIETFIPSAKTAYFLICFATFLWAMSTVVIRGVHETIPPLGLSFWRWFVGVIFLFPIVWFELRRKQRLIRNCLPLIFFMGFLFVGSSTMLVLGVNYTTAINATVINASQPAITAVMAWLLIQDRVNSIQAFGIAVGLLGVLVIVVRGKLLEIFSMDLNIGDGLVVLAIIGWGTYAVLVNRLPRELGLTTMLFLVLATGSLGALPFYLWETFTFKPVPFNMNTLIVFFVLGLIVSVGSVYLWNAGIRSIGPNKASIFLNLIPVFGSILAILFLNEALLLFHLVGAALVFCGILMAIQNSLK